MSANIKRVQLVKDFDTKDFNIGASIFKQFLWYFTNALIFKSGLIPFSSLLVFILKMFGAKIGHDVRIKPGLHIKYPWKLIIGDFSWIADCYIENLDNVSIGSNCCISQKAMLMTGNHDYKVSGFDLFTKPIVLHDGVWIGANTTVCPGVTCQSHAILSIGSVATGDLEAYKIYSGIPATIVRERIIT